MGSIRKLTMLHASRRLHALACLAVATPTALWGPCAGAADKAACVAAAEEGQRLKREGLLLLARSQLEICAKPDCPEVVAHDCSGWLQELSGVLASLVVTAHGRDGNAVSDVDVILDGSAVSQRPPTTAIELPPGRHVVRCERAGFVPWEVHVELGEGEHNRVVDCELTQTPATPVAARGPSSRALWTSPSPAPTPSSQPPASVPWLVWPLAGLGVAGLGSFAGFGITGNDEQNTLKRTCAPYCTASEVDPVATKFAVANVSLAVGAAALGTALVVFLLRPSRAGRN